MKGDEEVAAGPETAQGVPLQLSSERFRNVGAAVGAYQSFEGWRLSLKAFGLVYRDLT